MTEASLGRIGKYDLRAEIGRGGFGVVYRAVDTSLGREVALKVLHTQLTVDPEFVARFRLEAQTASQLDHPNIITVYEYGEMDGRFLIAMRYVPGQSLKQLVTATGPLPLERVVKILGQVAEALDYAHARGIIHRDVKSANILVEADDRVTLTDFGLVRAAEGGTVMTSLKSGAMIGTPEYMAPEQLDVDFKETIDARADVYSLGIVAFEMLAGRVPYQGNTPAVVAAHLIKPVPDIRQLQASLTDATVAAISKVLAKDRNQRFGRASEFAAALIKTDDRQPSPTLRKTTIGFAAALVLAAMLIGAVLCGLSFYVLNSNRNAGLATATISQLSVPSSTALPRPTQEPNASATTEPVKPTATKASVRPTATEQAAQATDVPTDTRTAAIPFALSSHPYMHKSGAFTVTLPAGWKVTEYDNRVFSSSPDNLASIDISFTNVGTKFDGATLDIFIKAEEDNWFGTYDSYKAKPAEKQRDGSLLIFKTLNLSNGTPQSVFSYYWQDGNIVYEQDFWTDTRVYDQYTSGLVQVANTMTVNSTAGAQANAYAVVYQFTDPNNFYQFKVPYAWTHVSSTATNTNIETFTAPDQLSYVENIEYNDGTAVTKADAGAFARTLLKQYYKMTDLKVTDDQPQSDGSEHLTWNSAARAIDGESFYETRGTTFLLLTWVADRNRHNFFKPVWTTLVQSYQVPQP